MNKDTARPALVKRLRAASELRQALVERDAVRSGASTSHGGRCRQPAGESSRVDGRAQAGGVTPPSFVVSASADDVQLRTPSACAGGVQKPDTFRLAEHEWCKASRPVTACHAPSRHGGRSQEPDSGAFDESPLRLQQTAVEHRHVDRYRAQSGVRLHVFMRDRCTVNTAEMPVNIG
jgi:hypothetical protein